MNRNEFGPAPTPPMLQLGSKTSPSPFILSGWKETVASVIWPWSCHQQASLSFSLPIADGCYFMAEVSALSHDQEKHPQGVTISINGAILESWVIDSQTIHDKLIYIPGQYLGQGGAVTIKFALMPSQNHLPNAGLQLHTIALHADLDAYLNELQTGFNWVCSMRNELIDTVRRSLLFLDNINNAPSEITSPLREILQNPYVVSQHETVLTFNKAYFQHKQPQLKEGYIHQAIRQWAEDLKKLGTTVVHAGNYATRQPEIRCWSQDGLNELLSPPLAFTNKIAILRELNTTLNNLEIILGRHTLGSVPPILYLDITNRCNFRCRMCYQSQSHFLRQNLINNHLAILINKLPYITDITVAGLGEPLLSKNLPPLAEQAKALQCNTTIITNGSLIAGSIPLLKQFSTVSISFDGSESETFEALRDRSNFAHIVNNIKKLRNEAPAIALAFSVVASRANLDELAGIVRKAADLGVNAVNITPLEHMPLFELKQSDIPLFKEQIAKARQIAEQAQITLTVAISPSNFSDTNDVPRDKNTLIAQLISMMPITEKDATSEEISQYLGIPVFNYYPDPIVFMPPQWPDIDHSPAHSLTPLPPAGDTNLDIEAEITRLHNTINECLLEIRSSPWQSFHIPYCLAPWKFHYIKNNGALRLCCHTDFVVGDLNGSDFQSASNSKQYQGIRQAMVTRHDMLPACRACKAVDRTLGLDSVFETAQKYGIQLDAHRLSSISLTDFSKSHQE